MPARKLNKAKPAKVTKKPKMKVNVKLKVQLRGKTNRKDTRTVKTAPKKSALLKIIRVGKAASHPDSARIVKNSGARRLAINGPAQRVNGSKNEPTGSGHRLIPAKTASVKAASTKLTKAELEGFRKLLMEKRREILGDVGSMESEAFRNQDNHSSSPMHMADVGTDNFEQEFTLGLIQSERELLKEIQEALNRIDDGSFGICVATGKPIGKARLEAKPWAKYCIEYALMLENRSLLRNGGDFAAFETADEEED